MSLCGGRYCSMVLERNRKVGCSRGCHVQMSLWAWQMRFHSPGERPQRSASPNPRRSSPLAGSLAGGSLDTDENRLTRASAHQVTQDNPQPLVAFLSQEKKKPCRTWDCQRHPSEHEHTHVGNWTGLKDAPRITSPGSFQHLDL
jgi:hypothetical protein